MDANGLTLEYLLGAIDAARKKKLAKSAGLLEEEAPVAPPEGGEEEELDPAELEALLAASGEGQGAPPAELPPEGVPPEDEEEV